jgi:hypothetical protein
MVRRLSSHSNAQLVDCVGLFAQALILLSEMQLKTGEAESLT